MGCFILLFRFFIYGVPVYPLLPFSFLFFWTFSCFLFFWLYVRLLLRAADVLRESVCVLYGP